MSSTTRPTSPDTQSEVLFQQYFKNGIRTYAAQVKRSAKGRPFLVVTEGKRDPKTDELRKSWIMVFEEDLPDFFKLMHQTAMFLRQLRGSHQGDATPPGEGRSTARRERNGSSGNRSGRAGGARQAAGR